MKCENIFDSKKPTINGGSPDLAEMGHNCFHPLVFIKQSATDISPKLIHINALEETWL